jgi:hypothetical protein
MSADLPSGLQVITEKLNFRYKAFKTGFFDTYTINLSDWNINLTAINPCIWIKEGDLQVLSAIELATNLRDVVRERSWENETILLFVDGKADGLRAYLSEALPTWVLIDLEQQNRIQQANSVTHVMLDILLSQMPRQQLAPYEIETPVTANRFFGRRSEINAVLQKANNSYIFVGIRRIGKTSLLKEIMRRMDEIDPPGENQMRRLYVDCSVISTADEFLQTITARLAQTELKFLMGRAAKSKLYQSKMFDRFYSLHGGRITFLVDELDRLLSQLSDQAMLFDVMREAAIAGKARFIMAGFRGAMNSSANQKSPFNNFAQLIEIGRLQFEDVERMIVYPIGQLRISFQNQKEIVQRIYQETAGLPNYVQFYCQILLQTLDSQNRNVITEDDLHAVYDNRHFRRFILESFMSNTEPLERALVYALVIESKQGLRRKSYSLRMMDAFLKKRNLSLQKVEWLENACRNLEVAGVLKPVEHGYDYEFAVPLLYYILSETCDVEFLFDKVREEVLAERDLRPAMLE